MDFNLETVKKVEFETKREAGKEAKRWNIGGMFPITPKVIKI